MKNLHIPLPDSIYAALRAEAERSDRPATQLARQAIADWLKAARRAEVHRQLAEYAAACAGTNQDLDPALENAAIDELRRLDEEE
ncbi:MAG: hypothetical protein HYY18_11090 [Planctomycetes bacterium]|nr:hypothetical protein [Planctomycetota bacterium]